MNHSSPQHSLEQLHQIPGKQLLVPKSSSHQQSSARNFNYNKNQQHTTVRTLLEALKECSQKKDLKLGVELHSQATSQGWCSSTYLCSGLIRMYSKCGRLADAQKVFNSLPEPDTVCWNCLINAHIENKEHKLALDLFDSMAKNPSNPSRDSRSFVAAISACAALADQGSSPSDPGSMKNRRWFQRGEMIHSEARRSGCSDTFVSNTMIDLCVRCGEMKRARDLFDEIPSPTLVSYTTLMRGYVASGESEVALELFQVMCSRAAPDARGFVAAISACSSLAEKHRNEPRCRLRWLEKARELHSEIVKQDHLRRNPFVQNSLIDLYGKCGRMVEAREVFDSMSNRDSVSWTALLQGYVENGESELALRLFECMEKTSGSAPEARTFVAALSACSSLASRSKSWLGKGAEIHSRAVSSSFSGNLHVQNTLVDMYAKFGEMTQARRVFDEMNSRSVLSWTALLQGYVDNGENEVAMKIFEGMVKEGARPVSRTYVTALTACTNLAGESSTHKDTIYKKPHYWVEQAKRIHLQAMRNNCCDVYVETALMKLYIRCGSLLEARQQFDRIRDRSVVTWTCLMQGYVDHGEHQMALELIPEMDQSGIHLNSATYAAALSACGGSMAVETGKLLHEEVHSCKQQMMSGKEILFVETCLVDFYSKCGNMRTAERVFDSILGKDLWCWNTLLSGYSQLGDLEECWRIVESMKENHLVPNDVTITHILSACSHAGERRRGREIFDEMKARFGITPNIIHYNCLVDLLSRGNCIEEAMRVVEEMPCDPNDVTWTSILGACQKWKNLEVGRVAYENLIRVDSSSTGYVLMAELYDSLGMGKERDRVLARSAHQELDQPAGKTRWTDVFGKIHTF